MANEIEKVHSIDSKIPFSVITKEVPTAEQAIWLEELKEVLYLYSLYENGSDFRPNIGNGDYVPSDLRFKKANSLIKKQARFMFSKTPDFEVQTVEEVNEKTKQRISTYQNLLDEVLKETKFAKKLAQASRDCFIGKRVALVANFNSEEGITLEFFPSTDFIYKFCDTGIHLERLVTFSLISDAKSRNERRIFKKTYEMKNGFCYITETVIDALGNIKEEVTKEGKTDFTYIPATVITNDGNIGDEFGESDLRSISEYESWFSKIANADIDAEMKSMNPIRYTIDMDSDSTKNLSGSAGSYWDLASDADSPIQGVKGQVGILETSMNYSDVLSTTLNRIDTTMRESLDIPDLSAEALKGVVSSGKTLKALYWSLIVRCDEKMLVWKPALEFIAETVILGAILYPEVAKLYTDDRLEASWEFTVKVENQYPLPEDEVEEKQIDILEVQAQVMSRKSYMKKWRGLTDEETDEELKQIALERQLLEDNYLPPNDMMEGMGQIKQLEQEQEEDMIDEEEDQEDITE